MDGRRRHCVPTSTARRARPIGARALEGRRRLLGAWFAALTLLGCTAMPQTSSPADARLQVMAAERAFAKTMADRDLAGFGRFVSEEAIFFGGPTPLRGRQQVVEGWRRFFTAPQAPFAWEPAEVEVLASGTLALSSGPVVDASGKKIATFSSIWRLEENGAWRVVFDKGNAVCDCAPAN